MPGTAEFMTANPQPGAIDKPVETPYDGGIRRAIDKIDSADNKPVDPREMDKAFYEEFESLSEKMRHELAEQMAKTQARDMAADVVRAALQKSDAPSLRQIRDLVGIDPSVVSKISVGALDQGPDLWTLFRIALALRKRVVVSFE